MQTKVIDEFRNLFKYEPAYLVKAPGRVNLIGEHTDYNDGFVLPMAINRSILLAFAPRDDQQIKIYSLDYSEIETIDLTNFTKHDHKGWSEYVKGVASVLKNHFGKLKGFDAVLQGNIPQGAGLSSSAALELATARVFAQTSNLVWNGEMMAKLAQKAENEWVGVKCGIMDQMIIALGKAQNALFIDCRTLTTNLVPLPKNVSIIIMDTNTRRGLVDSAYNERRNQCEESAKILNVKALRDVSFELMPEINCKLSGKFLQRARHVINENQRVNDAVFAMQQNNAVVLGELMNASHESLRNDFEVSSENLDIIVNCARDAVGCYGARMTGAGFGGCAVALVKEMYAEDFVDQVAEQYAYLTKLKPIIYVTQAMDGVALSKLS